MSSIKDEFEELALELFSEFEVGNDAREKITLTQPGISDPVEGVLPGKSKTGTFFPASYALRDVSDSIFTSDVRGIFLCSEWESFGINVKTKAVDDTGQRYKVVNITPSPKDVIYTIQLRKL